MAGEKLLLVEDDTDLRELIKVGLTQNGFKILATASGEECVQALSKVTPDLIVLDIMLPGMSGLEVTRHIRGNADLPQVPIVLHSSLGGEDDIVQGLELGADDYVVKDAGIRILVSRIRSVLRRAQDVKRVGAPKSNVVSVGQILIDMEENKIQVNDKEVAFKSLEYELLKELASPPGGLVPHYKMMKIVKKEIPNFREKQLDALLNSVILKLGAAAKQVERIRGIGYRLREEAAV